MPAVYEAFGDLLDARFHKIYDDRRGKLAAKSMIPVIFREMSRTGPDYRVSSITGFGTVNEFTGQIDYDDLYQGYDVIIDYPEYTKGFKIQRKLWDDKLFPVMDQNPSAIADAMGNKDEELAVAIFDNSFTSSDGGDGKPLCDDAHPSEGGGSTQDNKGSTAFSTTAVSATRILMRKFKDPRGKLVRPRPDMLVVSLDDEEAAWEVINSKGKVDTADNNRNYHEGKYKLAIYDLLDDTNNWWMADSSMMREGEGARLLFISRIAPEFKMDQDFDTYMKKWAAYMRRGVGYINWDFIYGHLVA